jgi:hypothetical protein
MGRDGKGQDRTGWKERIEMTDERTVERIKEEQRRQNGHA